MVPAPLDCAIRMASFVRASPTPRPLAPASTTTSSIQARMAVGIRNMISVSVPTICPPSLATRTVVPGAEMMSDKVCRSGGTAVVES